jgi:hypothetical protein
MDAAADDLALARHLGRQEAARFDAALIAGERQEREDRLTRLALDADDPMEPAWRVSSTESLHLERQVEQLQAFHQAVLGSRGWRMLQAARRLIGRAW